MSYQVLARKWRPKTFQDMVGQEHILRMLKNALEQQRLHHAYLLTGTRGVGKTTLGRILAKSLNCETGITSTPCGTCHACKSIDAGQFLDLYEVDAASRTKVEDTRELLENVMYPPNVGRYKIYLIDEVHMLSNHSFNALLKTLEEPPEHVKFLLATTDPKKLPITILSRCLQFHLKRILPDQITNHLRHICETEQVTHDANGLARIAKAADGSMRDALSLLDQAIAYGQGSIVKEDVDAMLGCLSQEDILPIVDALANKDGDVLFTRMRELNERAPDFQQVLEELISFMHQLAIAHIVPAAVSDSIIMEYTDRFTPEEVQLYYQIALLGRRDLALTPNPLLGFEMTLLRMLAFKPTAKSQPRCATTENQSVANASWRDLLPKLELSGMAYALATNCHLASMTDTKVLLELSANHQPMLNPKLQDRLADALSRYLGKTMQLEIAITNEEIITPAKEDTQEKSAKLANAKEQLLSDPTVKQLIDMYDATLDVSLIT